MKRHRIIVFTAACNAIILLVAGYALCSFLFTDYPPKKPDFTGYKPTVLPSGLRITGETLQRTIYRSQERSFHLYRLSFNKPDIRLDESATGKYDLSASCRGIGDHCTELVSARGQKYRVAYGEYQGKPFSLTVSWSKNKTDIIVAVDDAVINNYLSYNWQPMIDSFEPVNFSTMQEQTVTGHCCGG